MEIKTTLDTCRCRCPGCVYTRARIECSQSLEGEGPLEPCLGQPVDQIFAPAPIFRFLNVKAQLSPFFQEKSLVGAFSVLVKSSRPSFEALLYTGVSCPGPAQQTVSQIPTYRRYDTCLPSRGKTIARPVSGARTHPRGGQWTRAHRHIGLYTATQFYNRVLNLHLPVQLLVSQECVMENYQKKRQLYLLPFCTQTQEIVLLIACLDDLTRLPSTFCLIHFNTCHSITPKQLHSDV